MSDGWGTARTVGSKLDVTPHYLRCCEREGKICRGHRIEGRSPTPGEQIEYAQHGGLTTRLFRAVPLGEGEDEYRPTWWVVVDVVCSRWVVDGVYDDEETAREKLDWGKTGPERKLVCWPGTKPITDRALTPRDRADVDYEIHATVRARR